MSALPLPSYPVHKLYLFPQFSSREDFERVQGVECPPFDCARPPKYWFDPAAEKTVLRKVVYETAIAIDEKGALILDANGKPMTDSLVLVKKEAATVNIPPDITNYPGADVPPIPVPMRALDEDEELALELGGILVVHNKKLWDAQVSGYTAQDRALLTAIARKLGVPVAE